MAVAVLKKGKSKKEGEEESLEDGERKKTVRFQRTASHQ